MYSFRRFLLCGCVILGCAFAMADGDGSTGPAEEAMAEPKLLQSWDMSWWSVDGGGGAASGGDFAVIGMIGQPDTGTTSSCGVAVSGGLWSIPVVCETPLFCDGFESGGTDSWSATTP